MNTPSILDQLRLDLRKAMQCAAGGRPREGYEVLDGGLAAAELRAGEPEAERDLQGYREALVLFAQAHSIWFAVPEEADALCPPTLHELVARTIAESRRQVACVTEQRARRAQVRARKQ